MCKQEEQRDESENYQNRAKDQNQTKMYLKKISHFKSYLNKGNC